MARAQQDLQQTVTFVKGLVTEQSSLNGSLDAMAEGNNLIITNKGAAELRRGIDFENGYALTQLAQTDVVVSVGIWDNVSGVATESLIIVQVGTVLYFMDAGVTAPSSLINLTYDFSPHCLSTAIAAQNRSSFTSAHGGVVMVNAGCDPLYMEFDHIDQSLVVLPITLRVRDFSGIEDGLKIDERPLTLSSSHHYNLKNQGWLAPGETDPLDGTSSGGNPSGGGSTSPPDIDRNPWDPSPTTEVP